MLQISILLLSLSISFFTNNDPEDQLAKEFIKLILEEEILDVAVFYNESHEPNSIFVLINDEVHKILTPKDVYHEIEMQKYKVYFYPEKYIFSFNLKFYLRFTEIYVGEKAANLKFSLVNEKAWRSTTVISSFEISFEKHLGKWKISNSN